MTFDIEKPTGDFAIKKAEEFSGKYPFIVAKADGKTVGYAYAGVFKNREAYDRCVESTVYVSCGRKRSGIGKKLYAALENILKKQGFLNICACIAYTENEDLYLTKDSVKFHEKCGFRLVGRFEKCGYKFGRWYDMVWMEKHIGKHTENPPPIIPFNKIESEGLYEKN